MIRQWNVLHIKVFTRNVPVVAAGVCCGERGYMTMEGRKLSLEVKKDYMNIKHSHSRLGEPFCLLYIKGHIIKYFLVIIFNACAE